MTLRRKVLLPMIVSALLALGGCGGDVSRVADYQPARLLVLGDEYSLVQATATGSKYTINDPSSCDGNRNWVQVLADHYGMAFEQCNPNAKSTAARMFAAAGAKVADIGTQAAQAGTGLASSDLVTVFVGTHDVLAIFEDTSLDEATQLARAEAAGTALAAQINALIDQGARVIFLTVPDLGLSPYGLASGKAGLLTALCDGFNKALRLSVQQDGRYAAIVLADSLVRAIVTTPASLVGGGLSNVTGAACAVASPACTNDTLVSGASASTWMWADHVWLGSRMQRRLGELAVVRATNNPF